MVASENCVSFNSRFKKYINELYVKKIHLLTKPCNLHQQQYKKIFYCTGAGKRLEALSMNI